MEPNKKNKRTTKGPVSLQGAAMVQVTSVHAQGIGFHLRHFEGQVENANVTWHPVILTCIQHIGGGY